MQYSEFKPSAAASSLIKCFWVLEDEAPADSVQTIIPDGRPELIIHLGHPFAQKRNGSWHQQPQIFFIGQITGPFLVCPAGLVRTIGVRFRPEGASKLLRLPMFELTNLAVPLENISTRLWREIESLFECDSLARQLKRLEQILLIASEQTDADQLVSFAVKELEVVKGLISVGELARQVNLSARQFERRFRQAVGIPPKLFARMQRFQSVLQTIEQTGPTWVDAAVGSGYYDQSHLIRDFREFSGTTPSALLAENFDLTRRFS